MIIPVRLGDASYDIEICRGAISLAAEKIMKKDRKVCVVTDSGVPREYSERLLFDLGEGAILCVIPAGEENKSFDSLFAVLRAMLAAGFSRSDAVVALGGGVVGDLAGFAAATYMRGIDFYNIPTTLLSQVDSSIGGKVAINLGGVKNIVGAFHQPKKVICDIDTFNTLPHDIYTAGICEALKYGVYETVNVQTKYKDMYAQLLTLIDMIENDTPGNPTIDEVWQAFLVAQAAQESVETGVSVKIEN